MGKNKNMPNYGAIDDDAVHKIYAGEQLRKLREARGLQQKDIATITGVTQQQVGKYERGTNFFSPKALGALRDFFNVSADLFLKPDPNTALAAPQDNAYVASAAEGLEELVRIYEAVPKADRARILEYSRLLNEKKDKAGR